MKHFVNISFYIALVNVIYYPVSLLYSIANYGEKLSDSGQFFWAIIPIVIFSLIVSNRLFPTKSKEDEV